MTALDVQWTILLNSIFYCISPFSTILLFNSQSISGDSVPILHFNVCLPWKKIKLLLVVEISVGALSI